MNCLRYLLYSWKKKSNYDSPSSSSSILLVGTHRRPGAGSFATRSILEQRPSVSFIYFIIISIIIIIIIIISLLQ